MDRRLNRAASIRLGLCTALSVALLSGCAGSATVASTGASESVSEAGKTEKAIASAENAVASRMRSASARADLAQAYLSVGRFESAATTFADARELGENSPRTILGMALAQIASGQGDAALTMLEQARDRLPASDYGLGIALAGQPARGVAVLTDALRGGENTPKMRQNLGYAYALDGRWVEARLMVAQDVPADQVDARIGEWARESRPEDYRMRIANLMGVPLRDDPGQPAHLALNAAANPAVPQMAQVESVEVMGELPAITDVPAEDHFAAAFADNSEAVSIPRKVAQPVVQEVAVAPVAPAAPVKPFVPATPATPKVSAPTKVAAAKPKPVPAPAARSTPAQSTGTHLVQLGSFGSRANAEQARDLYASRHGALKGHELVIMEVEVKGRHYWRVAASGFNAQTARSACSSITSQGGSCLAYAGSARQAGKALASR